MTIVPLTLEAIHRMYGVHQTNTVRGYAVMSGDEINIIFGMYLDKDYWVAFGRMSDEMRNEIHTLSVKKIIVRCNRLLKQLVEKVRIPVLAVADQTIQGSNSMLEHFGCRKIRGEVYQWT